MSGPQPRLPAREPDGQFEWFDQWVSRAIDWIGGENALCADACGRICKNGADFMRARDEAAFPVRFWLGEGPQQTAAEKRKADRDYRRGMRLKYPWRYAK